MSIFNITESTPIINREEKTWVDIGVQFQIAKSKGMSATQFAREREINYGTFTKSMSRYKAKIDLAYKAYLLSKKSDSKLTKADRAVIMINSFRDSIRTKIRNEGAAVNNKSTKWFNETLKSGVRGHKVSRPSPGKIYAYIYDAKYKDTLPYWDKYPLIIFLGFGRSQAGNELMYGLNLHYIPPKARQQFLEDLLKQYSSTKTITNSTKLKVDWSKVKGFTGADKMIKAYLPGHIKGTLVEIKPSDWANVVLLPLQQFVSKGKRFAATKVWKS